MTSCRCTGTGKAISHAPIFLASHEYWVCISTAPSAVWAADDGNEYQDDNNDGGDGDDGSGHWHITAVPHPAHSWLSG